MIEFKDVSKTFITENNIVHAVKDVTFKISEGEVFGVIGYSGAGKSTLVRTINLLERPTEGEVIIGGDNILEYSNKELRQRRKKIGMIFQQFNLMNSRTVFENVAFALKGQGIAKKEISSRVYELLELVGISDKVSAYPRQLSGGQKQRVAIARALANDPDILLCDEATSALDPQTTKTILNLLRTLNERLKITIVVITHEMAVVKDICDRVAVMEDGYVVELGEVANVFANPQKDITKEFINSTSNLSQIDLLLQNDSKLIQLKAHQKLLRIDFFGESTSEALISKISHDFNTEASIIFANVEVIKDEILGSLIVILSGTLENQDAAIHYLVDSSVKVEVIKYGPLL